MCHYILKICVMWTIHKFTIWYFKLLDSNAVVPDSNEHKITHLIVLLNGTALPIWKPSHTPNSPTLLSQLLNYHYSEDSWYVRICAYMYHTYIM